MVFYKCETLFYLENFEINAEWQFFRADNGKKYAIASLKWSTIMLENYVYDWGVEATYGMLPIFINKVKFQ